MNFKLNGVKLGVQSWCFRDFKAIEDALSAVKAVNLDTMEISNVHVNVNDPKSTEQVLEACAKAGVSLSCMGIDGFGVSNPEAAENRFKFAKTAGMQMLGADPDMDEKSVEMIENLSNKYGLKLGIHNHGRNHRYGNFDQMDAVLSKFSPNMGVHMDAAWVMDSGLDPVVFAKRYLDRLYGVHLKDFTFNEKNEPDEVVLGEGNLKIAELIKVIKTAPNFKVLTIEYEGGEPISNIIKCVRNFLGEAFILDNK